MTQIIALVEPDGMVLAADRLLTFPDGSVHDHDATKMILFQGRLLLAYTGLASIGYVDTGKWIAQALSEYREASDALRALAELLTTRWRSLLGVSDDRLTVLGCGADYFGDELAVTLLNWVHDRLRPGGRVILGNFHPRNPTRALMDHVLDWKLVHRDESDLNRLFEG